MKQQTHRHHQETPSPPLSLLSLSHAFTPNLVLENLKSFISQPSNIGGLSILQTTQILKQLSLIYMWEVPGHKIADRQTQVRIFVRGIVPPEDCSELLKVVGPQPMSSGAQSLFGNARISARTGSATTGKVRSGAEFAYILGKSSADAVAVRPRRAISKRALSTIRKFHTPGCR